MPVSSLKSALAAAALIAGLDAGHAQQSTDINGLSYADVADLTLPAAISAGVVIHKATRLKGKSAVDVPAGKIRFYIEADVKTLIRGAGGLPARISYLVDTRPDAANRPPKLRKARMLLLAQRVPGKPNELRLVAPDAQLPWTQENESRVRAILLAAAAPDAPSPVTGVGSAFHVPGAIPGESETQIFLTTANGRPISFSILRRPAETPRWAVAMGEMVDDSAEPPARDTLLWYRLACFLPPQIPADSITDMSPENADATRADYRLVIDGLGPCNRTTGRS